jgi:predicted dienelactone hydrolase
LHTCLAALLVLALPNAGASSLSLYDAARQREVPVEIDPAPVSTCRLQPCPVALFSAGYGIGHTEYRFVAATLGRLGYTVVSVQHELPGDARMDNHGDLPRQRSRLWHQGAQNLRFVIAELAPRYPALDWRHPLLIGHSLGGDMSAALAAQDGITASAVITLDNRRARLPRLPATRVLTIRAGDTDADPGVLPTPQEQAQFNSCILPLPTSRHNDMFDGGSAALKTAISEAIASFLQPGADGQPLYRCP